MPLEIFTIGHSTHSIDEFERLLATHRIEHVADIRRYPGSRKFPHFNQKNLASVLPRKEVDYSWIEALGGRRRKSGTASPINQGLRNVSFRNCADYMSTEEFRNGIQQLLAIAKDKRTAFMFSESLFWRCHRRLVSDFLFAQGINVQHVMPSGELHKHTLTPSAKVEADEVTYPMDKE